MLGRQLYCRLKSRLTGVAFNCHPNRTHQSTIDGALASLFNEPVQQDRLFDVEVLPALEARRESCGR